LLQAYPRAPASSGRRGAVKAMKTGRLPYVLLSDDPFALAGRVASFGRRLRGGRVECALDFPEVRAGLFPPDGGGSAGGRETASDAARRFEERFGRFVVSRDGSPLPARLVRALARRRLTLACAESCSGGRVADAVTGVPGSSAVFLAGVVAYADAAKESLLGVRRATLARHGAVSGQVVTQLLAGALARTGADCAVALSGVAGPSGGTPRKPVGLAWIGAAVPGRAVLRRCLLAGPGREGVKALSAWLAMKLLLDEVEATHRR